MSTNDYKLVTNEAFADCMHNLTFCWDCDNNKPLKLVPTIFYQVFIFSPYDSPLKTMKNIF